MNETTIELLKFHVLCSKSFLKGKIALHEACVEEEKFLRKIKKFPREIVITSRSVIDNMGIFGTSDALPFFGEV